VGPLTPTTTRLLFPTTNDSWCSHFPELDPATLGHNLTYYYWYDHPRDIYNCSFAPPRLPISHAAVVMSLNSYNTLALYEVFLNCTREREMRMSSVYGNTSFAVDNYFRGNCWVYTTIEACDVKDPGYKCMIELRKEIGLEGNGYFECFPKLEIKAEVKGESGKMSVMGWLVAALAMMAVFGI
jgi:hypothetical protein